MTCTNPNCRHRSKRKLRPLVISLPPNDDDAPINPDTITSSGGESRREQITHMFATHPSLAAHFDPPTFSPGIPSRELRNRLNLLEHANRAGLIPDVEWDAICRALREQTPCNCGTCSKHNGKNENDTSTQPEKNAESPESSEDRRHKVIDPFRYLVHQTKVSPDDDASSAKTKRWNSVEEGNDSRPKKKKSWLEYKTTSLVPISPRRQGSVEDRALPYSMELWRKAKGLNRDRGVLGCTLAHLIAMKTLVGEDCSTPGNDAGFDFILEDNVRALVGLGLDDGECSTPSDTWTGWSCECANRIWDTIEASEEATDQCHMRYYGWLGSLPNLEWVYSNHLPRTAFTSGAGECSVFPFPTHDDFELDSIDAKAKEQEDLAEGSSSVPQFTAPGGTAVWGTFAYTISRAAYHSLINQLQHDVGSLLWKGKKMRAYRAKPIDKVLPRHVKLEYGPKSVHLPDKVAFVRAPMLGSLLHPHWEEGFCSSTEMQYQLSCICSKPEEKEIGSAVWDHVWLAEEERQIVSRKKTSGKWIQRADLGRTVTSGKRNRRVLPKVNTLVAVLMSLLVCLIEHRPSSVSPAVVSAFAFDKPAQERSRRANHMLMATEDAAAIGMERKRAKLGRVPIISRTIPIEIKVPSESPSNEGSKKIDVTVWEMDEPCELIQEWWMTDLEERSARLGDPFGVVMWPGSILASKELMIQHHSAAASSSPLSNATVLVLGAGTGVEAQTAALLGAKKVIATDINSLTLKLLEYGANSEDRIGDDAIEARYFDLYSEEPLPPCDILIAADVLYNPDLAMQVGRRLHESIVRSFDEGSPPTKVIITDSQKFHGTDFLTGVEELREVNNLFEESGWEQLRWETQTLTNVCGSGVLVEEDQVYDVEVRMIRWGWKS